jgi:gastrin-releasing peptide receptor
MMQPSVPSSFVSTTSKRKQNQDLSSNSHLTQGHQQLNSDNIGGCVNNSDELEILANIILVITDKVNLVQYFISEEANDCEHPFSYLYLKCSDKQWNTTQHFLSTSMASLRIDLVRDLAHSKKKFKVTQQLFEFSSRDDSNDVKYIVLNTTLCNLASSLDYSVCETSLNISLGLLNITELKPQIITESIRFLTAHNNTWISHSSCGRLFAAPESWMSLYNETQIEIHSINQSNFRIESEEFEVFDTYIDPAVYLVIFIVGMIGNGILLFVFMRHRETRTRSASMIINLLVCDLVNLILSVPLHCFFKYGDNLRHSVTLCRIVFSARHFLRSVSAFAVVALCIQRCSTVTAGLPQKCSGTKSTALHVLAVWLLPMVIAVPPAFVQDFYNYHCSSPGDDYFVKIIALVNVLLFCAVLPSAMIVCTTVVVQRLKYGVRNKARYGQCRFQEHLRKRSARVMVALAVVFLLSYFPYHVMILLIRMVNVDKTSPYIFYPFRLSRYLLFANGCFNPIALFAVSRKFRKLLANRPCCAVQQKEYIPRRKKASVYNIPTEIELK